MEQEVYVDLYFLINAGMDLLCLLISAALLHRPLRRARALLAAALGGAYAVASLLLGFSGPLGFAADCLAALLLCALAFSPFSAPLRRVPRLVLRLTAVYVLICTLTGGVMTVLFGLLNRLKLPFDAFEGEGVSVWIFAAVSLAAGLLSAKGGRLLSFLQGRERVTLCAELLGKTVTLCALVDTGNLLRDPVSGKSVIAVEPDALADVLPPTLLRACKSGDCAAWMSDPASAGLVRPIPAHTATGTGLLPAVTPQSLHVIKGKERLPCDHLLALTALDGVQHGFDAVMGPL